MLLACDNAERRTSHLPTLTKLAAKPQAANVLMAFASALQSYEPAERWQLTQAILSSPENSATIRDDLNLSLMMWYGIEPLVASYEVLPLLKSNPKLSQFAVRRAAGEIVTHSEAADRSLKFLATTAGDRARKRPLHCCSPSAAGLGAVFEWMLRNPGANLKSSFAL